MIFWWCASLALTAIVATLATRFWLIHRDPDTRDCMQQLVRCREALAEKQSVLEESVQLRTEQLGKINRQLTDEIRERQELEKALRISQQNYRSIVEDQTEMILRFDKQGIVTFANKAYCDRYGMTPEQAVGSNCFLNIHPDYREAALQVIGATTSQQPRGSTLIKVQRPDGSQDWAEWNGRALYDVDGSHLGYQGVGRIVTDLVETQRQLEASELQYRTIVEGQSELIMRFDAAGKLEFANAAFMRANKLTLDRVSSATIWDYILPEDCPRVRAAVEALTPLSPTERLRLRIVREGVDYWEDWYGHALYSDDGRFMCIQAVGRDVTKLVQAEDELRKKESLLRHATRLSTLGEMVAVITHELRQPLYSISNFAYACEQHLSRMSDDVAQKLRSWNHDIIGQVERANDIIARLRGFARRSDSIVSRVSINTVARESVAMLAFELNIAGIALVEQLDDTLPESSIDRLQMEQVFVNLIRNAYESLTSSPVVNPTITLRTCLSGDAIEVSVSDNGPGLSEDDRESIFQPFNTTKREGLGLGLPICRSIVEEHDGHIWAESNEPGAIIKFTLPIGPMAAALS